MAIYPVNQDLIPPDWTRDPAITPVLGIFHVTAGYGYSQPYNGLEWHFFIAKDGTITQRRDTGEEADANAYGNSFLRDGVRVGAISCETEGLGDEEWTPEQLASVKQLITMMHDIDGIPLVQADAWNGNGLGYHRLFREWNQPYHSCPGDLRVAQWEQIIVPWLAGAATPAPAPEPAPTPAGGVEDVKPFLVWTGNTDYNADDVRVYLVTDGRVTLLGQDRDTCKTTAQVFVEALGLPPFPKGVSVAWVAQMHANGW